MQAGHHYFISVRATNAAGLTSTGTSDGLWVGEAVLNSSTTEAFEIAHVPLASWSNLRYEDRPTIWRYEGELDGRSGVCALSNTNHILSCICARGVATKVLDWKYGFIITLLNGH